MARSRMIFAAFTRAIADAFLDSIICTSLPSASSPLTLLRLPGGRPLGLPLCPFFHGLSPRYRGLASKPSWPCLPPSRWCWVPQPRRPHHDLEEYPCSPQLHGSGRTLRINQLDQLIQGHSMADAVPGALRAAFRVARLAGLPLLVPQMAVPRIDPFGSPLSRLPSHRAPAVPSQYRE